MYIWRALAGALTASHQPCQPPSSTTSIQPLPSSFPTSSSPPDPSLWSPISTYLLPTTSPSPATTTTTLATPPTQLHDLELRQVTGQAEPGTLTGTGQISPVTTYQGYTTIAGSVQAVNIIYTQLFVAIPDQWPSPSVGSIGLGTITGEVGVVKKTKREALPVVTGLPFTA